MNMDVTEIGAFILKCSDNDLARIQAFIKARRDIKKAVIKRSLQIGDTVSFDTKARGSYRGKITKINRETAQVKIPGGGIWKVGLTLLKLEDDVAA